MWLSCRHASYILRQLHSPALLLLQCTQEASALESAQSFVQISLLMALKKWIGAIQEVSKVFLGASAVLSNGTVISRVGSAAVAMLAASRELPVSNNCSSLK